MADNTNQSEQAQTQPQAQNTPVVPILNPQTVNNAPAFNLSNQFKWGEPTMQKPVNINIQPNINLSNTIKEMKENSPKK